MTVTRLQSLTVRVCLLVLGVVALVRLGPATASLVDRAGQPPLPPARAADAGGSAAGVDVAFVDWVRRQLPPRASYWIASRQARDNAALTHWLTFRLLPRNEASGPRRADALIWWGDPAAVRRARRAWRVIDYQPETGSAVGLRLKP